MFTLNRIQRYIFRRCLLAMLIVMSVVIAAIILVDIVEQLRTVGTRAEISLLEALQLTSLKLPLLVEQTLPFAVLVGTILAYSQLNQRAELPVIRASGVSAWRFIAPAIWLSGLLGLAATMILNPFSARLSEAFEQTRSVMMEAASSRFEVADNGIWLRDGDATRQLIIHAAGINEAGTVFDRVKILEQERVYVDGIARDAYTFTRRIDAARAYIHPDFLQLEEVTESPRSGLSQRHTTLALPATLDVERLLDKFASPNTVGFWDLRNHITITRNAGLDPARYVMRFHGLIAAPLLFVAMALIGAIACLRLARLGGTAKLIGVAAATAIALFFTTQLAASLGSTGAIPAAIAAWSPPLFAAITALTIMAYREDG